MSYLYRVGGPDKVLSISTVKIFGNDFEAVIFESGLKVIVSSVPVTFSKEYDGVVNLKKGLVFWIENVNYQNIKTKFSEGKHQEICDEVFTSWKGGFKFNFDKLPSLRPPQIAALFAIGSHWTLDHESATIVMPTGTGKTETMISSIIAYPKGRVLIIVPSISLRDQTLKKFLSLGLLRDLGLLDDRVKNPVVGFLNTRITNVEDLKAFRKCNVVISTINMIGQSTSVEFGKKIAESFECLIIDEAHHVSAKTWNEFKAHFSGKWILQFTATPFRRDGKVVDGKNIFSYSLGRAQEDGYFKKINFLPIFEVDEQLIDKKIADLAITRLKADLKQGYDHLLMARCDTIERAQQVLTIYEALSPEFNPVLVTSKLNTNIAKDRISRLFSRSSRILICVDMFGEGFDLPNLKLAAVHDPHQSLGIVLQFTGRFTRTSENVGEASFIANIANSKLSDSVDRLYSEDADWNKILRDHSSRAIRAHEEMITFLRNCESLDISEDNTRQVPLLPHLLYPKFSAVTYRSSTVQLKNFHRGISKDKQLLAAWLNEQDNVLFFVTHTEVPVDWADSKKILNKTWDIFVVYYDEVQKIIFIHSSDNSQLHKDLAEAVGGEHASIIMGDDVFRVLGNISRLAFQQVGLKKPGRRNLRYSMYSGSDVAQALSPAQTETATKSNLTGGGFEGGRPVHIGCSYKGRVWTRLKGTVNEFVGWAQKISIKLNNQNISTSEILANVMIPRLITEFPDESILSMEWPIEILNYQSSRIFFKNNTIEEGIDLFSMSVDGFSEDRKTMSFTIASNELSAQYRFKLENNSFYISRLSQTYINIKIGRIEKPLEEYLFDCPPLILFINGSEQDGHLLFEPGTRNEIPFPADQIEVWDWTNIDISKESQWRDGAKDLLTVQSEVIRRYMLKDFNVIFDDDDKGEAADVICIKENEQSIELVLLHCKYSASADAGGRLKDVVEVSSQALRSNKWIWKCQNLFDHMKQRESKAKRGRPTRFERGDLRILENLRKSAKYKELKTEIIIVQPGISKSVLTTEQMKVLAASYSYILETVGINLKVIGSA